MAIKKIVRVGTKPAEPAPEVAAKPAPRRIRPKTEAAPAETQEAAPAAEATTAAPKGILTAAQRAALAKQQAKKEAAPAPAAEAEATDDDGDDLSWAYSGEEAEAKAAEIASQREEQREERRARGYWPIRFGLIPPSADHPDRYQADVIILDARPGPIYYEHVLRNPRSGFWDVYEPCPKERDSCPLCPPNGERHSQFVMLLTVLNINGYTHKRGPKAGQHTPITKELMVPMAGDHPFFHNLLKEHGTLRGIQLTMTRKDRFDPNIGKPTFVGIHDDAALEAYIKGQGMWEPKVTREGEQIAGPDWMMHTFKYAEFLHKPSGADLRARYANGGAAPVGASTTGTDGGQWGGSRYQPGVAGGPRLDDLDDDIPF